MSYLKIAPDLLLGQIELERLIEFVDNEGFRKNIRENSSSFGLVKNHQDSSFENAKVEQDTDVVISSVNRKTIKHKEIFAIDKDGQFIHKPIGSSILVPNTGSWYWVKIAYNVTNIELGTFSISTTGTLVGSSELDLTKVFRGQPFYPTKIKFTNSTGNTLEYEVLEVTSANTATLQHPGLNGSGDAIFIAETDLKIAIVGTFTPGITPDSGDKYPFQFDSCTLSLQLETVTNTPPAFSEGYEFYIARIKHSGSDLIIQDKRVDLWETVPGYRLENDYSSTTNGIIGIEGIRYDFPFNSRQANKMKIGWGIRSSDFTINTSLNYLTLNSIEESGKLKVSVDFVDGTVDGWRVYTSNGNYRNILSSVKIGSAIRLTLDVLDIDDFSANGGTSFITQEVKVVPNAERIHIKVLGDSLDSNLSTVDEEFHMSKGVAEIFLPNNAERLTDGEGGLNTYSLYYRYLNFKKSTSLVILPSDSENGFYNEFSYNDDGTLKDIGSRIRSTYTTTFNTFCNPDSYNERLKAVESGDLFGFEVNTLTSSTNVVLGVGENKINQYFSGSIAVGGGGVQIMLDKLNAKDGNQFNIFIRGNINLNGNTFKITEGFTGDGPPPTNIKVLTEMDSKLITPKSGLVLKCVYSGDLEKWFVTGYLESLAGWRGIPEDFNFGLSEKIQASTLSDTTTSYTYTNLDNTPTF